MRARTGGALRPLLIPAAVGALLLVAAASWLWSFARVLPWLDDGLFWFFSPALMLGILLGGGNVHSPSEAGYLVGMFVELFVIFVFLGFVGGRVARSRRGPRA